MAQWRDDRCSRCGGDLHETTSEHYSGDPGMGVFRPLPPVRCHRCTALSKSEDEYRKQAHSHALIHRVERVEPRQPPH